MMRFSLLCCALSCVLPAFAQVALPANAEHLRELRDDQNGLVDAARQYHLQQMDLSQWDFEISKQNSDSPDKGLKTASREMVRKRAESIRKIWQYVLSIYPNNARAQNYFGEYWYDVGGNSNAAITYWNQSILIDKRLGLPHNNLALHYFHSGDYRNGLFHIEKAVEIEPDNPDFLFNITQMYLNYYPNITKMKGIEKKKLYRLAMKHSEKAARNAPDDFSLVQDYAVNFFASVNFDVEADWAKAAAAWQTVQEIAKTGDHKFYAILNEGRCWIRDKDPKKALPLLESALAMRPESVVVQDLIFETHNTP